MSDNLKPECKLTGVDENVFVIIGTVSRALKNSGLKDKAKEFTDKAMQQESYDAVLRLCFECVDVC